MFCTPSLFLMKEFSWRFIVVCETKTVYQQTVNDVIVTLHCVSGRVGSLQLFGSSDGTYENISTKFTHISQKWFYFTVHYTFCLHISLGRCNWLRCRGTVFFGPPCILRYIYFLTAPATKKVTELQSKPRFFWTTLYKTWCRVSQVIILNNTYYFYCFRLQT